MSNPVLRPWRQADAAALRDAYRSSPDLNTQFGDDRPDTLASAHHTIDHALAFNGCAKNWAVVLDGVPVGNVGVSAIEWQHQTAWTHYWLASSGRGRGYATRAVSTVSDWAFEQGLFRLELGHRVSNSASCGVATRAGFLPEGLERQKLRYGPDRFDVELHARLAIDPSPPTATLPLVQ